MSEINDRNWQLFFEIRKELGLDKEPEPEVEEVKLRERARPIGSQIIRRFHAHKQAAYKPKIDPKKKRLLSGEIRLGVFVEAESKRRGLCTASIREQIAKGEYPVKVRHVSHKSTFVTVTGELPQVATPLAGEITLKQWIMQKAQEIGLGIGGAWMRFYRKELIPPPMRIVSRQIIYVKP